MLLLKKLSLSLGLSLSFLSPAMAAPANTDCYISIAELRLVHGCIFVDDGGPCTSWGRYNASLAHAPLNRTSQSHYEIYIPEYGVRAQADWKGKKARLSIVTPYGRVTKDLPVINNEYGMSSTGVETDYRNRRTEKGLSYSLNCSFGLSDKVNAIKAADEAEMDRLGPAAEWPDSSAPALQDLPIGTILELNRDLDIIPKSSETLNVISEYNGQTSRSELQTLRLPYRYAFAEFFNSNNLYLRPVHYPKGMKLRLVSVEARGDYHLYFETIAEAGLPPITDPIVRMMVVGRRSKLTMKVPQFIEMMKPAFDVTLP